MRSIPNLKTTIVISVGIIAATLLFAAQRTLAAEINCLATWSQLYPNARPEVVLKPLFPSGRYPQSSTCRRILLRGKIEIGDSQKFATFLNAHHPFVDKLYLWSPGGNVNEAILIGRLVRAALLATHAPDEFATQSGSGELSEFRSLNDTRVYCRGLDCHCASACFLIWAAGWDRSGNALGIHRPSIQSIEFGNLTPDKASILL
jgi:hypothetical protein